MQPCNPLTFIAISHALHHLNGMGHVHMGQGTIVTSACWPAVNAGVFCFHFLVSPKHLLIIEMAAQKFEIFLSYEVTKFFWGFLIHCLILPACITLL